MSEGVIQLTGFESHYLNHKSADVFFLCKPDDETDQNLVHIRVPAHKIILAVKSSVFNAMFYGGLPENGDVTMLVKSNLFKEFLKFFYCNDVNLTMDSIQVIIDLANQYQVENGMKLCTAFLKQNLSKENVSFVYKLALLYDLPELKLFCELSTPTILSLDEIHKCSFGDLKLWLQMTTLYAKIDMIEVLYNWARYTCEQNGIVEPTMENIQKQLGKCLNFIEWESLSTDQIQKCVQSYATMLTINTFKRITDVLKNRGSPCENVFISRIAIESNQIKRFVEAIETMTLRCNKAMTLKAIGISQLHWEKANPSMADFYGQILIMIKDTVIIREELDFPKEKQKNTHIHRFQSSIIMEPNEIYKLQVQLLLRTRNEAFVHTELLDRGQINYKRNGEFFGICFEGDTIIASLGLAVEYKNASLYPIRRTLRPYRT